MVITEEFGDWLDSLRRIDLLCVNSDANLVVIELKRSDDGGHMELQALRYAAMVSAMTFDQAVETFARYKTKLSQISKQHVQLSRSSWVGMRSMRTSFVKMSAFFSRQRISVRS